MSIKVSVSGACGKMGSEVIQEVINNENLELVCAVDKFNIGAEIYQNVHVEGDLEAALLNSKPDVVVDFTQPDTIFENVSLYLNMGIKSVIGTTGLAQEQINELKNLSDSKNTGCIIAPNFSTGAILMIMFSKMAAKYFNNAEILEFHHNQKKDAPSGTAIKTAQLMREVKEDFAQNNCAETETIAGSRGGRADGNIQIHSIRMPGFVASQEVVFGSSGQTLKIRHDSIDRKCYMQGVALAINHVFENNKFIYGLENIL
jgi:4-hydroxy-tetrahydrodipicolinate reductase